VIDLDPRKAIVAAPTKQPHPALVREEERAPIYKRWPFWAGVGATVLVGSIAIYAATGNETPSCSGCSVVDLR
jgi:hypothetical protein